MPLIGKKRSSLQKIEKDVEKRVFGRLSLHRDDSFVPNVVTCLGVVFVRRGLRNVIDTYFFPNNPILGNILAVLVGIFLLYLPDGSLTQLGGYEKTIVVMKKKKKTKKTDLKNKDSELLEGELIGEYKKDDLPVFASRRAAAEAKKMKHHGHHKHHKHPKKHHHTHA